MAEPAVPAGAAFLEHYGARPGLAAHTNQLDLSLLDHVLVDDWLQRRPDGFHTGLWEGPYPPRSQHYRFETRERRQVHRGVAS